LLLDDHEPFFVVFPLRRHDSAKLIGLRQRVATEAPPSLDQMRDFRPARDDFPIAPGST
jgi:hypothetical protein